MPSAINADVDRAAIRRMSLDHPLRPTSGSRPGLSTQLARAILAALAALILTACGGGQNDASGAQAVIGASVDQAVIDASVDSVSTGLPSGAASGAPAGYTYCAAENGTCSFSGTQSVVYGANNRFYTRTATGSSACNNATFGDPISGTRKSCYVRACTPTAITPYLMVSGGAWQHVSTVTAPSGSSIKLGPQPLDGTWRWWGSDGFTATSREITRTLTADTTYTADHTNPAGCMNHQIFTLAASSGTAMPVGDLPGWRQVVAQDFTTARPVGSYSSAATTDGLLPYPDHWTTNDGLTKYAASKTMSAHDGYLDVHFHSENGTPMAAAWTVVDPTTGWGNAYLRTSMRFKTDSPVPGYGMAAMLWPDSNTWGEGEIDYPEGNFADQLHVYDHCLGANPRQNCVAINTGATYQTWHIATTEWTPSGVKHYLDGVLLTPTFNVAMTAPHHWVIQTGSSGSRPADTVSGHLLIDWVTMYVRTTAP